MTKQLLTADWVLVTQYHQGSDDAIAALFQKYSTKLYRKALSILSNHHDAEDCVQEVLIQLLSFSPKERASRFKSNPSGVLPSLYMRVRNKAIDIWRKNQRKSLKTPLISEKTDMLTMIESRADTDKDTLELIFQKELLEICKDCLKQEEEQIYLQLFLRGYDRNSIAQEMKKDCNGIKVLRQRVMRRIQRNIIPYL